MIIAIDLDAYYEWEPAAEGYEPTEDERLALAYKPGGAGGWLKKVLVDDADTHTAINIPESEFLDAAMAAKAKGKGFSRGVFAAWYIDEVVMRHHAPSHAFKKITVHDDPALESLLNQMLVPAKPAPSGSGSGGGASGAGGGGPKARPYQRTAGRNFGEHGEGTHSHFMSEVRGEDGFIKSRTAHRHNLTTDTATGYTNRRDWQSKIMGGGLGAFFGATCQGTLTACTATVATNSGASFPTAGQALAGYIVVVGANASGTGSVVMGVIVSNTGTALTVDQWYNATGGVGTTPNATGQYFIVPGGMPAMYLALTSDAGAASAADTTLASEATTNGFARALGTWAHTAAATTYTLQKLFTAAGSLTVNKEGVFASAVAALGAFPFESAEPTPPALISGDTLTQTVTITIN
jgi:hypothetical protein